MGLRNQFFASGVLSLVCIGVGILESWPAYTIILFKSENTTLSRPMNDGELSLFGSLSCIGALIATPLCGILLDKLGRKKLTICITVVHVLTWIIRSTFKNVHIILLSAILAGFGNCGILIVVIFVSEYCQESIRGALTSAPNATAIIGMLISYWIGGTLNYYTITYICIVIGVFGILMMFFLQESPTYLMKNGLEKEAVKSIAFYRNAKKDSDEVAKELDNIKRALNPELDETPRDSPEDEKLNPESTTKEKLNTWQFFKKSRSSRRTFGVCFTLAILSVFQGMTVVQVYGVTVFKEAVPTISSTICTVIFALVSLISVLVSGYLTDVAGRRILLMYGSLGAGICCILVGLQLQVTWGPYWMTAMLIYLYSIAYASGPATVPFILIGELFLPEIKGIASMLIGETLWVANFILLFIFNPLSSAIGLHGVFYVFSTVCLITTIFTYFMLPETKGLPVDKIQLLFTNKTRNRRQNEV